MENELNDYEVLKEIEIKVFGRVQGIYFRKLIKKEASLLNLRGYVMNRKDGSVLIVIQGKNNDLEKFLEWIKGSPGFSSVNNITLNWIPQRVRYSGFDIVKEDSYLMDKAKSLVNLGKSLVIDSKKNIPTHVVIIPDGNRRWARERMLNASFGHYTSASDERILELLLEAKRMGIEYLSLWGFSTENWKRDKKEIYSIFKLLIKKIDKLKDEAHKHRIRFRHLGRKDRLPKELLIKLNELENETKDYSDFNVNLLLDYGGRDEIIRAINKVIESGVKNIDEKTFEDYLDSKDIPDPDLIIRTSGEMRTSGVMPYTGSYAELYFTNVYFPEFDTIEFRKAIKEFGQRVRRFGATAKQDLMNNK